MVRCPINEPYLKKKGENEGRSKAYMANTD
jgi:hypothetical protein